MQFPRFRNNRLLMVAAAVELFLGLAIYVFPSDFTAPAYASLRPFFPYFSSTLVVGGVLLLMLGRYRMQPWVERTLCLLPIAPLLVLVKLFTDAAIWTGTTLSGMMALALLVAPWLPAAMDGEETAQHADLFVVVLALTEAVIGALMLLDPNTFAAPSYGSIVTILPLGGVAGLFGAAALSLPEAGSRWGASRSTVRRWVAAVLPLLLAYAFIRTGLWTGVLTWGTWAVALLAGDRTAGKPTALTLRGDPANQLPAFEGMLEAWIWFLALVVVLLSALAGPRFMISPVATYCTVLALSAYNIIVQRVLPRLGTLQSRIFWHLAVLTMAVSLLVGNAGIIGHGTVVLLAVTPPLATRILGPKAGRRMLALALGAVAVGKLSSYLMSGTSPAVALGETAVDALMLAVAALVGMRSAGEERRLRHDLANTNAALHTQVDMLELVGRIGDAISRSLNLDEILCTTVNELGRTLEVSRCFMRLKLENERLPVVHEYLAPGVTPIGVVRIDHLPAITLAVREHTTIAVSDVETDPRLNDPTLGRRADILALGARAVLVAPILIDEELLGVIGFHQCSAPRQWTPQEVWFLETIAEQAGIAIAHARTHRALTERHAQSQQAYQDLQAATEELLAQQEELQAMNEELLDQSATIRAQRDQVEEALESLRMAEEGRTRLVAILEATPDFVGIVTATGAGVYLNHAARKVLGISADADITVQPLNGVHPEWARTLIRGQAIPAALRDGVWSGETAWVSRTGREIPVSEVLLAHTGPDGSETFLSIIARDISDRKRMEAVLRESEERFRTAFENAPIGVALIDTKGAFLKVNRSWCEMLGYAGPELLEMTIQATTHPDDLPISREVKRKLLAGEARFGQFEQQYYHKLGHTIWAQVSISMARDALGGPPYFIVQVQDITERKRADAHLIYLANHDPLTGLFNRHRFQAVLEQQLEHARRSGTHGALLYLDLDGFKYVNDSLGHQAGDDLLRSVAGLLRQRLRETDIVARLGGDEFAILLPESDRQHAETVARETLDLLRQHLVLTAGQPVRVTASIGVALYPLHATTAEEVLSYADLAMYNTKEVGRNDLCVYAPDQNWQAQIQSKLTWERRIREALEHDRFILHYQPILDLRSNQIVQYEMLLRMIGDDGALIAPGAFLNVAERFGLIRAIDRWVVRQAIHLIAQQQRVGTELCLEVNLSGKAFSDRNLLAMIQQEIDATGINPACLVLEITETAAIADIDQALGFINTLTGLGCRFAIDDFGAGFSSFLYLKHLPADYLKIDGTFIQNLSTNPADQHLVKAMVELARGLGKRVIAEAVEDEATVKLLQSYGVDFAQGYHVGRPKASPA